jgi:hypothetical protein
MQRQAAIRRRCILSRAFHVLVRFGTFLRDRDGREIARLQKPACECRPGRGFGRFRSRDSGEVIGATALAGIASLIASVLLATGARDECAAVAAVYAVC